MFLVGRSVRIVVLLKLGGGGGIERSCDKRSLRPTHLFCRACVVYLDHLRGQIDADALVKVLTKSLVLRIVSTCVL